MIRPALSIFVAMFITACGGESYSEQDLTPEGGIGERTITIDLVNTANQSVDFFVKEAGSSEDLFNNENKVATTNNGDSTQHVMSWSTPTPLNLNLGIWDTNTQTEQSETIDASLNSSEKVWAIAWSDNEQLTLSTFSQESSLQEGTYQIRVFSHTDVIIVANASSEVVLTHKKGNVTNQLTVENCENGLLFNTKAINLCNLDLGKSYLLITDGENLLAAEEEK